MIINLGRERLMLCVSDSQSLLCARVEVLKGFSRRNSCFPACGGGLAHGISDQYVSPSLLNQCGGCWKSPAYFSFLQQHFCKLGEGCRKAHSSWAFDGCCEHDWEIRYFFTIPLGQSPVRHIMV